MRWSRIATPLLLLLAGLAATLYITGVSWIIQATQEALFALVGEAERSAIATLVRGNWLRTLARQPR